MGILWFSTQDLCWDVQESESSCCTDVASGPTGEECEEGVQSGSVPRSPRKHPGRGPQKQRGSHNTLRREPPRSTDPGAQHPSFHVSCPKRESTTRSKNRRSLTVQSQKVNEKLPGAHEHPFQRDTYEPHELPRAQGPQYRNRRGTALALPPSPTLPLFDFRGGL